jgi:hypothetical protein
MGFNWAGKGLLKPIPDLNQYFYIKVGFTLFIGHEGPYGE